MSRDPTEERAARAERRVEEKLDRAQEKVDRAIERVDRSIGKAQRDVEKARRGVGDLEPIIWMRPEPSSRGGLTRDRIAAAALGIADEEGFEAVSMRRVAQKLDAGTMTLYHYVLNKDELITLMVDAVMREVLVPDEELAGEWRAALTQIANRSLAAFRNHRWTLDRFGDGRPGPNGIRHFEQSLQAVAGLEELDRNQRFELIALLDDYVFGFVLREAQELAEHERGWPPEVAHYLQHELDSGRYPLVREYLGGDIDAANEMVNEMIREEGRFERGLQRLLDGIEGSIGR